MPKCTCGAVAAGWEAALIKRMGNDVLGVQPQLDGANLDDVAGLAQFSSRKAPAVFRASDRRSLDGPTFLRSYAAPPSVGMRKTIGHFMELIWFDR